MWLYAAFWASMPLVGWGSYAPEPFGTSCTLDWWLAQASASGQSFVMAILFFCLIFPAGIIVFSYVMIIYKVKSSAKEMSHFDTRNTNSQNLEIKLTKVRHRLHSAFYQRVVKTGPHTSQPTHTHRPTHTHLPTHLYGRLGVSWLSG